MRHILFSPCFLLFWLAPPRVLLRPGLCYRCTRTKQLDVGDGDWWVLFDLAGQASKVLLRSTVYIYWRLMQYRIAAIVQNHAQRWKLANKTKQKTVITRRMFRVVVPLCIVSNCILLEQILLISSTFLYQVYPSTMQQCKTCMQLVGWTTFYSCLPPLESLSEQRRPWSCIQSLDVSLGELK